MPRINSFLNVPNPGISQYSYAYDNVGNRLTMTTAGVAQNYSYDSLYQLISVTGAQTHSFAYDKLGNRVTADGVAYTSNNLNQYVTVNGISQIYDANGNLTKDGTKTYSYDEEGRLTAAGTSTYIYDAYNKRVAKNVGGVATYYIHDEDNVIEERNGAGVLVADYAYGPNIDEALTMTRSGSTYKYFYDGLGSARQITNPSGTVLERYDYDPTGKPTFVSAIGNRIMFTGRWYDPESGNYYYRNRYMNPSQGRFLQRDPLKYVDGMNMYSYVSNNSINLVDPYGLYGTLDCSYYQKQCDKYHGEYYCTGAKKYCRAFNLPPLGPSQDPNPYRGDDYEGWQRCTRQCLQDCDNESNQDRERRRKKDQCTGESAPNDDFWDKQHFICHAKCYPACTNSLTAPKGGRGASGLY